LFIRSDVAASISSFAMLTWVLVLQKSKSVIVALRSVVYSKKEWVLGPGLGDDVPPGTEPEDELLLLNEVLVGGRKRLYPAEAFT
jgi:hypothetical protein